MSTVTINTTRLTNKVKPKLNSGITNLKSAANTISSISIPSDFSKASTLRGTKTTINGIKTDIDDMVTWVEDVVTMFKDAETRNQNIASNLTSRVTSKASGSVLSRTTAWTTSASTSNSTSILTTSSSRTNARTTALTGMLTSRSLVVNELKATNSTTSVTGGQIYQGQDLSLLAAQSVAGANFTSAEISLKSTSAVLEEADNKIINMIKSVGADISNTAVSLVKGVAEFGESFIDFCGIVGTGISTVGTGIWDGVTYVGSLITGTTDSWESVTVKNWQNTMSVASETYVKNAFSNFYENNLVGQWLDSNAHDVFKSDGIVSTIATSIGYVGGILLETLATFGLRRTINWSNNDIYRRVGVNVNISGVSLCWNYS